MNAFFNPKCLTFGKDISNIIFTEQTVQKIFKTKDIYDITVEFYEKYVTENVDRRLFPRMLGKNCELKEIIFENCGDLMNLWNLPVDWEEQLNTLRNFFKTKGVLVLDIRFMPHTPYVINNLCVKNDRIYLVDVGFYAERPASYIDAYFNSLIWKIHIYNACKTWKCILFPLHILFYIYWLLMDLHEKIVRGSRDKITLLLGPE